MGGKFFSVAVARFRPKNIDLRCKIFDLGLSSQDRPESKKIHQINLFFYINSYEK